MKKFGLNKRDKLCSTTAIDYLFSHNHQSTAEKPDVFTSIAYPLRAVWSINKERQSGAQIQFLISVPKKRLRHAVDRVKMRRRIRESYRLHRTDLNNINEKVDLAFIYISDNLKDYADVEKSMLRILSKIELSLQAE